MSELTKLNEELSNRNLMQVNNDLTNLLTSINIPILMVDEALTVRRATPLAEKLFNLIPTDITGAYRSQGQSLHQQYRRDDPRSA